MSTEIEVNNCFVIWLFNLEWKCSTFTFVAEVNLQPKDFLTSLSTFIKIFLCSILQFEMYINSLNVECKI